MRLGEATIAICATVSLASCVGSSADSPPPGASSPDAAAETPAELCNFQDDDGDGRVDEGFAWHVSPWTNLWSTRLFAIVGTAISLSDGRTAFAGIDGIGNPEDNEVFLAVLGADGSLLSAPARLSAPRNGPGGLALAERPNGELVMVFGSTDYNPAGACSDGCPATVATVDSASGLLLGHRQLDLPFPASQCLGLWCGADSCVAPFVGAADRACHIVWFDPQNGLVSRTRQLEGPGTCAISGGPALAWVQSRLTADFHDGEGLFFGSFSSGGQEEQVPATRIVAPELSPSIAHDPVLVRDNDSYVVLLQASVAAVAQATIARVSSQGKVLVAPASFPNNELPPVMLGGLGSGSFLVALAEPVFGWQLLRLGQDLAPLPSPANPVAVPGASQFTVFAASGAGVTLVRGTYDGRTVDVARLTCE